MPVDDKVTSVGDKLKLKEVDEKMDDVVKGMLACYILLTLP